MLKQISVILPIYKPQPHFLIAAVDSILKQTFPDFELILIDDGNDQHAKKLLKKIKEKDQRIRIVSNARNKGIVHSLNLGIKKARAPLIARMDADDIAPPDRLKAQIEYMAKHPDIFLCGGQAAVINNKNQKILKNLYPDFYPGLPTEYLFLFENPIIHPTVVFKKFIKKNVPVQYLEKGAEDLGLWLHLISKYQKKLSVLEQPLLHYRMHAQNLTRTNQNQIRTHVMEKMWQHYDYYQFNQTEKNLLWLMHHTGILNDLNLEEIKNQNCLKVLKKIENRLIRLFKESAAIKADFKWRKLKLFFHLRTHSPLYFIFFFFYLLNWQNLLKLKFYLFKFFRLRSFP